MKSFTSTAVLLASIATATLAQNTTLPFAACLLPCDQAALAKVGCSASDIACHCRNAPEAYSLIIPCVLSNSTCGANATADLLAFGKFAADSCVAINMTATNITDYLNTTASSNTTGGTSPTPSVYTGAAMKIAQSGVWVAIAGAAGLALAL